MFQYWNIVDTVDTADIVHTVDTLDIVKSVNSVDNVSSVNSVHNVHNAKDQGSRPIQKYKRLGNGHETDKVPTKSDKNRCIRTRISRGTFLEGSRTPKN